MHTQKNDVNEVTTKDTIADYKAASTASTEINTLLWTRRIKIVSLGNNNLNKKETTCRRRNLKKKKKKNSKKRTKN